VLEVWERPPSMQKTLTVGPLGGGDGGLGVSTTQLGDVDDAPPGPLGAPDSVCCPSMCCNLHR
jgi:hypothetical protein